MVVAVQCGADGRLGLPEQPEVSMAAGRSVFRKTGTTKSGESGSDQPGFSVKEASLSCQLDRDATVVRVRREDVRGGVRR
jgi:hypothetical protein